MSNIFIRIYLDEDVNVLLADLLKARGFEAITTREAGQLSKTDEEQLTHSGKIPECDFPTSQLFKL